MKTKPPRRAACTHTKPLKRASMQIRFRQPSSEKTFGITNDTNFPIWPTETTEPRGESNHGSCPSVSSLSPPLPRLLADSTNERWPRDYERRMLATLAHRPEALRGRNLHDKGLPMGFPSSWVAASPMGGGARTRAAPRRLRELESTAGAHLAPSGRPRRAALTRAEPFMHKKTGQVPSSSPLPYTRQKDNQGSNPGREACPFRMLTN